MKHALIILAAALSIALFAHYMESMEQQCLELENLPRECEKL